MTDPTDGPARPDYAPRPRWVKVLAVSALVMLLVVVVLLLGGEHGPGRHLSGALPDSRDGMSVVASAPSA